MKQASVLIRVHPTQYSDNIFVHIPPRLWRNKVIADAIARAIRLTFEDPGAGGIPITDRPTTLETPCKRKRQARKKTRKKVRR